MVSDLLLHRKLYAQLGMKSDLLLSDKKLAKWALSYLISCKVEGKSKNTISLYERVINRFIKNDYDLQKDDIRLFLLDIQSTGVTPHTVHVYYRSLKTFCLWLIEDHYIDPDNNPMLNVKPPKLPRKIIKPFEKEDIINMLKYCSNPTLKENRNKAIVLLLWDTGMRVGELAGIKLSDIDFSNATIRIFGKGSKERVVHMGNNALRALIDYLRLRNDDYDCLWVTWTNTPMKIDAIKTVIKRLCRRADVKNVKPGPHTFRHTFAEN